MTNTPNIASFGKIFNYLKDPTLRLKEAGNAPLRVEGALFSGEHFEDIEFWYGSVPSDHVQAGVFNTWGRQAYVAQGAQFPDSEALDLDIATGEVTWLWLDNANAIGFAGFAEVTLTDLHDPDGNPLA